MVSLIGPSDEAISGVLWQSRGPWLILRDATGFKDGVPPKELKGEVLIERRNVAFLQVLP